MVDVVNQKAVFVLPLGQQLFRKYQGSTTTASLTAIDLHSVTGYLLLLYRDRASTIMTLD